MKRSALSLPLALSLLASTANAEEVAIAEMGVSFEVPAGWEYSQEKSNGESAVFISPPDEEAEISKICRIGPKTASDEVEEKELVAYYDRTYSSRKRQEAESKGKFKKLELIDQGRTQKEDGAGHYWLVRARQAPNGLMTMEKEQVTLHHRHSQHAVCLAVQLERDADYRKSFNAAAPAFDKILSSIKILP